MASMQVSGAAAAGRARGPPRRGERRRGVGVRDLWSRLRAPSPDVGASGDRRVASQAGVSAGGRGQSQPRSSGIKAAEGEERAKFGVRSAVGAPLRAPARARPPLGFPVAAGMLFPSRSPTGWKQLCPQPSPGDGAAGDRQSVGQPESASPRTAACPRRSAASARPPTRSFGSPGSCWFFSDLHPVPRGCLLLSACTLGIPWQPTSLLRSRPSSLSPASCATQRASSWACSSASIETRPLNFFSCDAPPLRDR